MSKSQNILKKIAANADLISDFQKIESFKEFYNFCKKIEPNITEEEVREIKQELFRKDSILSLSDDEADMVAGGKMDFNKFKAVALSSLLATSMIPNTSYAMQTTSLNTAVVTQSQTENRDQKTLNEDLLRAVNSGDKTLIEKLIAQGADINAYCGVRVNDEWISGNSLGVAVKTGQMDIVELLVEKGANINDYICPALDVAVKFGNFNIIEYLLDHGAKDVQNGLNCVLSEAIGQKREDIVRLLLERGANPNKEYFWTYGNTMLMDAAHCGNADIVKLLLEYGANPFNKDDYGKKAHDYAKTDEIRGILKAAEKKVSLLKRIKGGIRNFIRSII